MNDSYLAWSMVAVMFAGLAALAGVVIWVMSRVPILREHGLAVYDKLARAWRYTLNDLYIVRIDLTRAYLNILVGLAQHRRRRAVKRTKKLLRQIEIRRHLTTEEFKASGGTSDVH